MRASQLARARVGSARLRQCSRAMAGSSGAAGRTTSMRRAARHQEGFGGGQQLALAGMIPLSWMRLRYSRQAAMVPTPTVGVIILAFVGSRRKRVSPSQQTLSRLLVRTVLSAAHRLETDPENHSNPLLPNHMRLLPPQPPQQRRHPKQSEEHIPPDPDVEGRRIMALQLPVLIRARGGRHMVQHGDQDGSPGVRFLGRGRLARGRETRDQRAAGQGGGEGHRVGQGQEQEGDGEQGPGIVADGVELQVWRGGRGVQRSACPVRG